MSRILVVEDEPDMLQGLIDNLEFEGYEVEGAQNGKEGLELIMSNRFNLVILDVMLPEMSGFDVCKEVRRNNNSTPILLLTAKGEELDKVLGLEFGADDYVTKPFSLRELLARVKALLRRSVSFNNVKQDQHIVIGQLEVDFKRILMTSAGKELKFTHKEFEVLKYLWEHKNMVVSRDSLIENVWDLGYEPTQRTIDNFIVKLRSKIEKDPSNPKHLLTVHGVGYKLIE
jgi:DNA-binding response OmpR family regulator